MISAFKFAGSACAPLLWLPLYHLEPEAAFVAAAIGLRRARRGGAPGEKGDAGVTFGVGSVP